MKNVYMGIDQSYTSTGICILNDDGNILHSEVITTDKSEDIYSRAGKVATTICLIVQQYKPTNIAIEGLAFGMRGNATRDLAGLQFIIVHELNKIEYTYKIVSPLTIKKLAMSNLSDVKMKEMKKKMMHEATPDDVKEHLLTQKYLKTKGLYDVVDAYFLARSII